MEHQWPRKIQADLQGFPPMDRGRSAATTAMPLDNAGPRVDSCGVSAQGTDRNGQSWTMGLLLRIPSDAPVLRCVADRTAMLTDTNQKAGRLICARICAERGRGGTG